MGPLGARVVVSCEHAGNSIPARYAARFDSTEARRALDSHRGWDPGSLELGRRFARDLAAPIVVQRVSRLLVECNRSLDHPRLFSEFSRDLPPTERQRVIETYWRPHRDEVRALVGGGGAMGLAVHVGMHTFTPVYDGRRRATDVGILFDPSREPEASIAHAWRMGLRAALPGLRVYLNRPYRGWSDGLTTTLRGELAPDSYAGLELEVSQRLSTDRSRASEIASASARALDQALRTS